MTHPLGMRRGQHLPTFSCFCLTFILAPQVTATALMCEPASSLLSFACILFSLLASSLLLSSAYTFCPVPRLPLRAHLTNSSPLPQFAVCPGTARVTARESLKEREREREQGESELFLSSSLSLSVHRLGRCLVPSTCRFNPRKRKRGASR